MDVPHGIHWQEAATADLKTARFIISQLAERLFKLLSESAEPVLRAGAALCCARLQDPSATGSRER
jgi:hypothetical protein